MWEGRRRVHVIGEIRVEGSTSPRPLTRNDCRLLAALVAAGPRGIDASELETVGASRGGGHRSQAAVRQAVSRLREHAGDDALPDAADGRYRLNLPTDDVDAWRLLDTAHAATLAEVDSALLLEMVETDVVYPGVDLGLVTDDSTREITDARRRLVVKIGRERPDVAAALPSALLCRHLADEPSNERLIAMAARARADEGDRRGALLILDGGIRELRAAGVTPDRELRAVEAQLLADGATAELITARTEVAPRVVHAPAVLLPAILAEHHLFPRAGASGPLEQAWQALADRSGTTVLVDGPAGAGKSRLLADLAARAAGTGRDVAYAMAPPHSSVRAFGPVIDLVPDAEKAVRTLQAADLDPDTRRAEIWAVLRDAIADRARANPAGIVLLVDDVHWIDSRSADLLVHLIGARIEGCHIVLAGRSEPRSSSDWQHLRDAGLCRNAVAVTVGPLDPEAVRDVAAARRPDLTLRELSGLQQDLWTRSGGLPGVAIVLIAGYDRRAARLPTTHELMRDNAGTAWTASGLSASARVVGGVAAVIGQEFDIDAIVRISGLTEDEALDGTQELLTRGLLADISFVRFRLAHALVEAAFLGSSGLRELVRWNARASEVFATEVHRSARHLANALPYVPRATALDSQLRSAHQLLADGLHREAVMAFGRAVDLGGTLSGDDVWAMTRALDLTGAHEDADRRRTMAVDRALAAGDHETALRLTMSGLPEAEQLDGAPGLVHNLARIDRRQLGARSRWLHAHQLARQLAILGRIHDATNASHDAMALARGVEQRVASALLGRYVISGTAEPQTRLAVVTAVATDIDRVSTALRAEHLLVTAIDLYESGRCVEALARIDELDGIEDLSALRRWHVQLFRAMAAADAGDVERSRAARTAAHEFAVAAGIREADTALVGAAFVDMLVDDHLAVLLGVVEDGVMDPAQNLIARAGVAAILHAVGREKEAVAHAEAVAEAVLEAPVYQGVGALAVASPVLACSPRADLIADARDLLAARGDSLIVLGAGATCLGPATRYVAALTSPDHLSERLSLLRRAAALCDRAGSTRWATVVGGALATASG